MLIASVTVAAMFTVVELIVIMQVLVLMCLMKLMVGQSTCSTATEIKRPGMAMGRLWRGCCSRMATIPPKVIRFDCSFQTLLA